MCPRSSAPSWKRGKTSPEVDLAVSLLGSSGSVEAGGGSWRWQRATVQRSLFVGRVRRVAGRRAHWQLGCPSERLLDRGEPAGLRGHGLGRPGLWERSGGVLEVVLAGGGGKRVSGAGRDAGSTLDTVDGLGSGRPVQATRGNPGTRRSGSMASHRSQKTSMVLFVLASQRTTIYRGACQTWTQQDTQRKSLRRKLLARALRTPLNPVAPSLRLANPTNRFRHHAGSTVCLFLVSFNLKTAWLARCAIRHPGATPSVLET